MFSLGKKNSTSTTSEHGVHIPERFRNKVCAHVLKVCLNLPSQYQTPLILGIQGPPGCGKSFQTRHVLTDIGVCFKVLDCSSLSGEFEGDSIKALKRDYLQLGTENQLTAILIDDFDISIASQRSGYERTSNSDILNAFLMHLCDDPTVIDQTRVHPVPIIVTGNDFSVLYGPLLRHGRADLFEWVPSEEERMVVVKRILGECGLSDKVVWEFVGTYEKRSIAFFQQVKCALIDKAIESLLALAASGEFDRHHFADVGRKHVMKAVRDTTRDEIFHAATSVDRVAGNYL